jgi:hypothetical protein
VTLAELLAFLFDRLAEYPQLRGGWLQGGSGPVSNAVRLVKDYFTMAEKGFLAAHGVEGKGAPAEWINALLAVTYLAAKGTKLDDDTMQMLRLVGTGVLYVDAKPEILSRYGITSVTAVGRKAEIVSKLAVQAVKP